MLRHGEYLLVVAVAHVENNATPTALCASKHRRMSTNSLRAGADARYKFKPGIGIRA